MVVSHQLLTGDFHLNASMVAHSDLHKWFSQIISMDEYVGYLKRIKVKLKVFTRHSSGDLSLPPLSGRSTELASRHREPPMRSALTLLICI